MTHPGRDTNPSQVSSKQTLVLIYLPRMFNDLVTPSALFGMWKYVDDTTLSEKVPKGQQSRAQEAVDHVSNWSAENLFQLNLEKTKELTISFRRSPEHFDPVTVDGTQIQTTTSSKLLGLIINNTLTWNDHVDSLIKKAARKILSPCAT